MKCFLRYGDGTWEECTSIHNAVHRYTLTAKALFQYEQRLEASIHLGKTVEELAEYPDFVLSVGPKGGVRVERTY